MYGQSAPLLKKATLFFSRDPSVSRSTEMLSRKDSSGPFRPPEGEATLLQSEEKEKKFLKHESRS